MLGHDLDLAFASEPNAALRDSLRRAADAAIPQIAAYVAFLERDVIPNATGDFTIGAANVARRYLAEELIDTPLDDDGRDRRTRAGAIAGRVPCGGRKARPGPRSR